MVDHDLAIFHDPANFVDNDVDVGERVAFDCDKVSEVAWSDCPELIGHSEESGGIGGGCL